MKEQTIIPIPVRGRINAFDSLKSAMIFFVVVMHVSMTFMHDAPSWWYVISGDKSHIFVVVINILDVFMIPVLFFISGYFTPASYLKKGTLEFLKDKVIHIGLAWILGLVIIIPLFPVCAGKSVDYVIKQVIDNPLYLFYNQSHLWYLGILFLFLTLYAIYADIIAPVKRDISVSNNKPAYLLAILIIIAGICSYLSNRYITNFDNWINLAYVFSLKPAKIMTYICIYILGIYAWKRGWFKKEGWMPDIRFWRICTFCLMVLYMVLRLLIIPHSGYPALSNIEPVIDCICSFFTLIYAIMVGIKFQGNRTFDFLTKMSPYSYGIYWVHMPVMILYLYTINDWDFPIFLKWISGILFTIIISWLISKYILKKVPVLKRIF